VCDARGMQDAHVATLKGYLADHQAAAAAAAAASRRQLDELKRVNLDLQRRVLRQETLNGKGCGE
jgi:hypothetical protein